MKTDRMPRPERRLGSYVEGLQVAKSTTNSQQSTVNEKRNTHHASRNTQVVPSRIELHIGELALHGFDHVDPAQIGTTVRQELSRLLAESETPSAFNITSNMINLDGETFTFESGTHSETIGVRIARAIYRGLER